MTWTIDRLGLHGDGIAEGPVFVPRTLPGEVVTGTLSGTRVADAKIVTPSDQRIKAPCKHYARCGGCALQHAHDDFVASWKRDVVVQALAAQGLTPPVRDTLTSAPQSRRRATFSGRRLKKGTLVGFHTKASDTIVPVTDCQVVTPALQGALGCLADLTALVGSRKAEVKFTVTATETGLDIDMALDRALEADSIAALADLARQHDLARLGQNGEPILTRRPPILRFDGIAVQPPPGAFLQATADGEAALRQAVLAALGPVRRVADLFAGCGTFALPLARQASVLAVEGDAAMTDALHAGWRGAEGLKSVTVETRDLFRRPLLADELAKIDGVVIDPPRAGAEAQVAELAKAQVGQIAYVSCNPVTFARDAKMLLSAGYRLNWVQVVDQFRWSSHIELAASLTAPHIAA